MMVLHIGTIMPDSDIIRVGLPQRCSTIYKQICEGVAAPGIYADEYGRKTLKYLKSRQGLADTLRRLQQLLGSSGLSIEHAYAARDRIVRQEGKEIDKRTRGVLNRAFTRCILEGSGTGPNFNPDRLIPNFAAQQFETDLKSPILDRNEPHFDSADHKFVEGRLELARSRAIQNVENGLRRMIGMPKLTGTRSLKRPQKLPINANTDLLSILSKQNETTIQPKLPL